MGFNIRKKRKYVKAEEFVKEIKKIYKEVRATLIKLQKEIKKYMDKNRKEIVEYKVRHRVLISMKDFLIELTKRVIKKLIQKYIKSYIVIKNTSSSKYEKDSKVLRVDKREKRI